MNARRLTLTTLVSLCALAGVLALGALPASATVSQFGSEGPEAGQFATSEGIAVDQASGDVYLADFQNRRVDKFTSEGVFLMAWGSGVADGTTQALQTCTATCYAGLIGTGAGQFGEAGPVGIAVDNDPLSLSYGDIYVTDGRYAGGAKPRVEKFAPTGSFLAMYGGEVNENGSNTCLSGERCQEGKEGTGHGEFTKLVGGIAVDSSGDLFVADNERIQEFNPAGLYVKQLPIAGSPNHLAIDTAGNLYAVGSYQKSGVRKYDQTGTLLQTFDAGGEPGAMAMALDSSGDVFVDDLQYGLPGNEHHHMLKYDSAGKQLASFDTGSEETGGGKGIAFGNTIGALYVLNKGVVRLISAPPPGPLLVGAESASKIQRTSAVLAAGINPEGNETSYRFEYGTSSAYGTSVPTPDGGIGSGFESHTVSAEPSGLSVRTTYHYRVVATNSTGTAHGPDQTFTTLPPVLIDSESVVNVASSSATLEAQINPLGSSSTYRFEYGTSTSYGTSAPVPDASVGSGTGDVEVGQHLQGLQPATTYHYRVVAQNALGTVEGEDRTFTTEAAVSKFELPDGRAWEMVSPPNKQGAKLDAQGDGGSSIQASANGNAIAYEAGAPTEVEPQGNRSLESINLISQRGAGGWATKNIEPPHDAVGVIRVGSGGQYQAFSSDLSLALLDPSGRATPLSPETTERTPYLRHDETCEASPATCYQPLVTPADVLSGTKWDLKGLEQSGLEFEGGTPDLSHAVVHSAVALTETPVEYGLYEWAAGKLQLVSVLPLGESGAASAGSLGIRGFLGNTRHAISDDGTRIVWTSSGEHLYMRDMAKGKTIRLDPVENGARGGEGKPIFQTASSDGSKVFFTDTAKLTVDSTALNRYPLKPDLYEFDVETGKLKDLSVDPNSGEHADIAGGVLGASEDGSYVYFVANGALAGAAKPGGCNNPGPSVTCNLYLSHNGALTFIATLSSEDGGGRYGFGDTWTGDLSLVTARVSPNGGWLTFMSDRSLTGYDNRDANSGIADEEVFLYDASANRIICASCNPTGARPVGAFDIAGAGGVKILADNAESWQGRWLAATIAGWTHNSIGSARYQPRYLSDSGRLFFNSNDALTPRDTNGTWDVYQYEPGGVGGCSGASASFNEASHGCVGLISTGGSAEESTFIDASESGNDVFFLTAAALVPQDYDGALDMYDARVCTTASPCLAVPPVLPPPCSTSDSCKPAPSPQPESFGAPSSATFSGAGNIVPTGASHAVAESKFLSAARKLARALKACGKKPRHKRGVCERQARRRYAKSAQKSTVKASLSGRDRALRGNQR
jgi:hypothetical protein